MGSSRPRNSTRAGKARSVKRTKSSGRRPDRFTAKPRIPAAIEVAIDEQRTSIGTAISLLYCLHSALRREIEDAGRIETEAVEDAAESADPSLALVGDKSPLGDGELAIVGRNHAGPADLFRPPSQDCQAIL